MTRGRVIGHAPRFRTWPSLVRTHALANPEALSVMTALVAQTAAAGPPSPGGESVPGRAACHR